MVVTPLVAATVDAHHTSDYPSDVLAVRRGQPIELKASSSTLTLTPISAGPRTRGRPTGAAVRVLLDAPAKGWSLTRVPGRDNTRFSLLIPASAAVGLYALSDGDAGAPVELAVLFNPFLEADSVHMPSERERQEYVFNESGLIWRGSADSNYPAAWDYAQFDGPVVSVALWLLESLSSEKRGDPVAVTRHLSAAVNANDDGGVLVGRWDGSYDDGVPPSQWTGSGSILRTFYDSAKPVKYGQCWVFAGLLTSVCRALGIPTRVTTNFASAHDTTRPFNRAVDLYFDRDGDMIENRSADSIWNFHVWCDAWMQRPDLVAAAAQFDVEMDGWQAIDATPQELSDGVFQMGPSPLNAVKNGYSVEYDTDFVIGEVNADILYYWQKDGPDGNGASGFTLRNKRTRGVGKFTSTKAVASDRRNDITSLYKHPEGSEAERMAHANHEKPSDLVEPEPEQPTALAFTQTFDPRVRFGDDIRVVVSAKNNGKEEATARLSSLVRATRYTGEPTSRIDKKTESVVVPAGRVAQFVVTVPQSEYMSHLVRDVQTVKFVNSAKVAGTGQAWADECIVRVYGDDALDVSAPRALTIGRDDASSSTATVTVTNRFRVALTNVVVNAEGRGVAEPVTIKLDAIEPGAKKQANVPLKASAGGDRTLVVTLDTDELQDITKSVVIRVNDLARMNWLRRLLSGIRRLLPF